jgi:hypothetical protein
MFIYLQSTLILKMNAITNIDQFGRDLSLRRTPNQIAFDKYMNDIRQKLKTMSWAELTYEAEEEEERLQAEAKRQRLEKERAQNYAVSQQRKALLAKGEYELEDGEIIE